MAVRNDNNNNNRNLLQEIKILQHNVQHWSKERAVELGNYYRKEDPDIILLNSTGMKNQDKINIYNYNVTKRNTLDEMHAGVAIAVKKNIKYCLIDDFRDDILGVKVETTKGPIMILTTYCPPRRNYMPTGEIENKLQMNIPVYFAGDLNARLPALGYGDTNNKGREIQRLMGMNKIIHMGPDFRTLVHRGGRPDIVFSNRQAFLNYAIIRGSLTTSDHFPLILKLSTKPILKNVEKVRCIRRTNWDNFRDKVRDRIRNSFTINEIEQRNDINADTIEEFYGEWYGVIERSLEETSPKVKRTYFLHARDSDYLRLMETVYRDLAAKPVWTRADMDMIKELQRRMREENLRLYREAWEEKVEYLNTVHKDSSKFWSGVGRLIGNQKEIQEYILDPNARNRRIFEPEEKEEIYRNIWKNIFSIPPEDNAQFNKRNEERVLEFLRQNDDRRIPHQFADLDRLDQNNYLIAPVRASDIDQIIKKFKNKAPGISGINKLILSNLPLEATEVFAMITNLTLSMGYYPIIFKNGLLVFAQKGGKDPRHAENYRPITLLEVPGKIVERIINDRISYFFETNNIFNAHQYGFRKNRGTDMAIAVAYEKIALSQQKREHCNVVCRDVAKAFDRVWVEGLQYKVLQTELPDLLKKVLCSFVNDRTAQIKIEKYIGPKFHLHAGVPQGSILSPTLFIFYTSEIPEPVTVTDTDIIFADDVTQVIIHETDREELAIQTEREIVRINNYEKDWKIKTNKNKFKMITASKTQPAPIRVDDENVILTENVNILGLTLKRTGCVSHITMKIATAAQQLLKLRRFYRLRPELQIRLYLTLIRPIMEYPPIPVALASRASIMKMQRVQNRALIQAVKGTEDRQLTIKEIHEKYGVDAINVRLAARLTKTWSKVEESHQELYDRSTAANNSGIRDHAWWPRAGRVAALDPPEPLYTL